MNKLREEKIKIRLKKADQVQVIAGKDKGKIGKILEVLKEKNQVIVEGVNFLTNYERPTQQNQKGGLSKKEGPIHISNVLLYSPHCEKGVRIRNKKAEDGSKLRVCSKTGDVI